MEQSDMRNMQRRTERKVRRIVNWHEKMYAERTVGQRLADSVVASMGSWKFLIWQTLIVGAWITLNLTAYIYHWDPYPFILLNLLFSTQAAYAAPLILMSQNRENERDRIRAQEDYETNLAAKEEIEQLMLRLDSIEKDKLDKILAILEQK